MKRHLFVIAVSLLSLTAFVQSCKDAGTEPPPALQPPSISSITPDSAFAGDTIKVEGAHFGSSRGTSKVSFGGTDASVYAEWKDTEIKVQIPSTIGSGTVSVIVTVEGKTSSAKSYKIRAVQNAPVITSVQPDSGSFDDTVAVIGKKFGAVQATSTVTFTSNVTATTVISWSDTLVKVKVPQDAITGSVTVTVGGLTSNGVNFKVTSFTGVIVSFSGVVHPILLQNCAISGCHTGSAPASGFNQSTYEGVRRGGSTFDSSVVIPFDSSSSGIMKMIRGTNNPFGQRMPLTGQYSSSGLPDSFIVKIGTWIMQGAKNN